MKSIADEVSKSKLIIRAYLECGVGCFVFFVLKWLANLFFGHGVFYVVLVFLISGFVGFALIYRGRIISKRVFSIIEMENMTEKKGAR